MEKEEIKYSLPKPGLGTYLVAYINSQALDAPSIHELVSSTLTRNIGDISICHDNYNRPNGYIFIRVFEHPPISKLDVDRFRASTFNGASITARLFKDEDEFKEYLESFSLSILNKIPSVPTQSQLQFIDHKTKFRPYYHHIILSELPEDIFEIKSHITVYTPVHKAKYFTANGKKYADFYFLKVNDANKLFSLYKKGVIKFGDVKMYSFCGAVESKFLMLNNVSNADSSLQKVEEFGQVAIKQYIPNTKQLIIEMKKTSSAGRAACILKNESNLSITTIHEGYFKQLHNKYSIKEGNKK